MIPWLVVMAASAGGVQALRTILSALPSDLPAAVVILQHRPADQPSYLIDVLGAVSRLPVGEAVQGQRVEAGRVYVAAADSHLTVTPDHAFIYRDGSRIRFLRASANPLLESAAPVYDGHVVAVVLTGGGSDASDGVQAVKAHGGVVIAQDQASSEIWSMPSAAIRTGVVDYVLPVEAIGPAITDIVHARPVAAGAG